jgi:DNA ligase (NAD+)
MDKKNIKNLCERYLKYKYQYYIIGNSELSDASFDAFEEKLKNTGDELALQVVELVDFPSVDVIESLGLDINNIAPNEKVKRNEMKYKHYTPMLSIQKVQCNDEDDLPYHEIDLFLKRMTTSKYAVELKYDGNSMSYIYKDGKLFQCLTRGDGKLALDRPKMKLLVPNTIPIDGVVEIRGEVLIEKKLFREKYADPDKVQNERNVVAGYISTEDIDIKIINDLTFVAYSIVKVKDDKIEYIEDSMKVLSDMGFNRKYVPKFEEMKNISDFDKIYKKFKQYKEESQFLIDGFVIKFPENLRYKMGDNGHHVKWALACKFKSEEVTTTIINIEWSYGKNEICPVAILEPVILLDTMVSRCSLHNLGFIINNGAFPGAIISLKKSGDIIPRLTSVVEPSPDTDEYMKQYINFINS